MLIETMKVIVDFKNTGATFLSQNSFYINPAKSKLLSESFSLGYNNETELYSSLLFDVLDL